MGNIKILTFFLFSFLFSFASLGQYANYQTNADSTAYYPRFWTKALDSLQKQWIHAQFANNEKAISQKRNQQEDKKVAFDNLLNKPQDLGITYTPRAKEIYALYEHYPKKSNMAIALFQKQESVFKKAVDSFGLPPQFAFLPFAVSAMDNTSRSFIGGAGFWQISYTYGKKQGLQIDSYVDERLDVTKASMAAAKILKSLYDIYGDWKLTLAAYTCGPSNVNKAIRRNGDQVDFYAIRSSLPYFGRDVVDALAASVIFLKQNDDLFVIKYNPVLDTIEVSKRLHFKQIADLMNLKMDEIRYLNPVYKYDIVPAINKVYFLFLPQGSLQSFNEIEDSIYSYKDSILFNLHKRVILPPPPKGRHWATPSKAEIPENSVLVYYTIKSGDNLGFVASWFDVGVSKIEDWNNIYDPRRIQIGKKLKIYVPKSKAAYYKKINTMSMAQKQKLKGKTYSSSSQTSNSPKPSQELTKGYFWHTVKNGESPYIIAKKYPGVSADDILRWNNISDATKIQVGQKLKIKRIR